MNQTDLPNLTVEQLARIVCAAEYESRRAAKRCLRDHLPGRRSATASDLDAVLAGAAAHPDKARIDELVEELLQKAAADVAAFVEEVEEEERLEALEAAALKARIDRAEAQRDWEWLARHVLANPPDFSGGDDGLPGGLTRRDVAAEWLADARDFEPVLGLEELRRRAAAIADGRDRICLATDSLLEVTEAAYGYCVADRWLAEQKRRTAALQAAEELAETFKPLLDDCRELASRTCVPDGKDDDEVDECNRLHASRSRLRELRGLIELVRLLDDYEPARARVDELLAKF